MPGRGSPSRGEENMPKLRTSPDSGSDLAPVELYGCILDMDGVVTNTARIHAEAWKRMFDEFLQARASDLGEELEPFDGERDYLAYIDGKPRYEGAESFLASRGIDLPRGDPGDRPDELTVCGLGNRKNAYFRDLLERQGAEAVSGTVDFVRRAHEAGLEVAVISSSRNSSRILGSAGVDCLFDVILGGVESAELGLAGKPAPDIFLRAASELSVDPGRAMVVEDAQAGIEAARRGGFALVVGLDAGDRREELLEHGAHIVVEDLSELEIRDGGETEVPVVPNALDRMDAILSRLSEGVPALFLDYDGTLTPIVDRPEEALLPDRTRCLLERISGIWFTAVVSGRDLRDVMDMVGIRDIVYAGSHGFDVSGMDSELELPGEIAVPELLAALDEAEEELRPAVGRVEGARLERKRFAIAVHYRTAPEGALERLRPAVERTAARHPELRVVPGKMILELRPDVDWDKGKALLALMDSSHLDARNVVPVYIGDDTTDEDAFRAIADRGVGVVVEGERSGPTAASYSLRDTREVAAFLDRLVDFCGESEVDGSWKLVYEDFDPGSEKLRETLCATGNGYFVTRGAAPELPAGEHHYPGTYIGGVYNRRVSRIAGREIENESIVNVPNWLEMTFRAEGGERFDPEEVELHEYRQELDIYRGVLGRTIVFTDREGRRTRLTQSRFAHMGRRHLAGLRTVVEPENWSGRITVRSGVDGRVENSQVERYGQLDNHHLEPVTQGCLGRDLVWVQVETNQSHVRIAVAARTRVFLNGKPADADREAEVTSGYAGQDIFADLVPGDSLRVDKVSAMYTSRDHAISESLLEAADDAALAPGWDELLSEHEKGWRRLWDRCGIDCRSRSTGVDRILNLHIFHLLQTVSPYSIGNDVGVPPRGLHGEAYRGLIMWDELFIFPFLDLRIPDITRTLLLYRYRRMRRAARAAARSGYRGLMFPWQSGSNGREEAQTLHLNPESGRWIPDNSQLQRHIGVAVAYNAWKHYEVTGDLEFMLFYGAELMAGTARFWASLAHLDPDTGRYGIHGVMGPDEFHDAYPGAEEPGLRNNAYTNLMVAWVMCRTLEALEMLPPDRRRSIRESMGLTDGELETWEEMSRRMCIPFHGDRIISQFEGYERLLDFDWAGYEERYGDIHRLDRILEAEGDTPNRYKVSKQADVLMIFFLLSADEIEEMLERLGYDYDDELIGRNVEYYLARTSHGSTLSRLVHSWVLARSHREESWNLFREALQSDVADTQGGTTHEGIHLGAMAGTVDLVQRCYTGLQVRRGELRFDPRLPEELEEISFSMRFRGHWLDVTLDHEHLDVSSRDFNERPVNVGIHDDIRTLEPGGSLSIALDGSALPEEGDETT